MKVRTAWPWISLLLVALAVLNPFGFDFLYLATFSGEELSRNIAGPIVLTAFAVLFGGGADRVHHPRYSDPARAAANAVCGKSE